MAIDRTLQSSKVKLVLALGTDAQGNPRTKDMSLGNIKLTATDQAVYNLAGAIVPCLTNPLATAGGIVRTEAFILEPEA